MTPLRLNRRRFLGCSAAAGLALSHGDVSGSDASSSTIKLGLIGVGNRGTALLRSVLELPGVEIVAVADPETKHRLRGSGIIEKAGKTRPDLYDDPRTLLARTDLGAVITAVPCDLHAGLYIDAIRAGKHLYAEKPLALTVGQCDAVIAESKRSPEVVVHVGHQRRSNPRYVEGVAAILTRAIGDPIEARASWTSSNGPVRGHGGWLGLRERSGDWMVEQAVHIWDVLHWLTDSTPDRASGIGRSGLFAATEPGRNVTDWYSTRLEWESGFAATFTQSWIDPADDAYTGATLRVVGTEGGIDLAGGAATFRARDRSRLTFSPGPINDTSLALERFVADVRHPNPESSTSNLANAREAVITGLMVRSAVDSRRIVLREEISPTGAGSGV